MLKFMGPILNQRNDKTWMFSFWKHLSDSPLIETKKNINKSQGLLQNQIKENGLPHLAKTTITYLNRNLIQNELLEKHYRAESKVLEFFFKFFQLIKTNIQHLFGFITPEKKQDINYEILSQVLSALRV
jgi:hypothetical protein